nr:TPA_asm: hypothetical protein [Candiseco virus 1]
MSHFTRILDSLPELSPNEDRRSPSQLLSDTSDDFFYNSEEEEDERIPFFKQALSRFVGSDELKSVANSITTIFADLARKYDVSIDRFVDFMVLIYDLFDRSVNQKLSSCNLIYVCVRVLRFVGIGVDHIHKFIQYASDVLSNCLLKTSPFHLDSLDEDIAPESGPNCWVVLVALVGTCIAGVLPTQHKIQSVFGSMRNFNIATATLPKLLGLFEDFVAYLPDIAHQWIRVLFPLKAWVQDNLEQDSQGKFKSWIENCQEVMRGSYDELIKYDVYTQALITRLLNEGEQYERDIESLFLSKKKVGILVARGVKKLRETYQTLTMYRNNIGARHTPFCVYIYGRRGVGKSTISNIFARHLAPNVVGTERLMYTRNSATNYWDAYFGQHVVKYDDFGQVIDSGEIPEFMHIVSNAQYVLPMASLDDCKVGKKGTLFTSPVVICCANVFEPRTNEIIDREALMRRRHVVVKVTVKKEFLDRHGLLDYDKIDGFNHLCFEVVDQFEPKTIIGRFDLEGILEYMRKAQEKHIARETKVTRLYNQASEDYMQLNQQQDSDVSLITCQADDGAIEEVEAQQHVGFGQFVTVEAAIYRVSKEVIKNFKERPADIFVISLPFLVLLFFFMVGFLSNITAFYTLISWIVSIIYTYYFNLILRVVNYGSKYVFSFYYKRFENELIKQVKQECGARLKFWVGPLIGVVSGLTLLIFAYHKKVKKSEDSKSKELVFDDDCIIEEGAGAGWSDGAQMEVKSIKRKVVCEAAKKIPEVISEGCAAGWSDGAAMEVKTLKRKVVCEEQGSRIDRKSVGFDRIGSDEVLFISKLTLSEPSLENLNLYFQEKFFSAKITVAICGKASKGRMLTLARIFPQCNIVLLSDCVLSDYDSIYLDSTLKLPIVEKCKHELLDFSQFSTKNMFTRIQQQGCVNGGQLESIRDIFETNLYRFSTLGTNGVNGIFVKDTLFMVPYHVFINTYTGDIYPNGTKFLLRSSARNVEVTFEYVNLTRLKTQSGHARDLCLYKIKNINNHRDITKNFASVKAITEANMYYANLVMLRSKDLNVVNFVGGIRPLRHPVSYSRTSKQLLTVMRGWRYEWPTQVGDCGGVLFLLDGKNFGKIVGMHVAGAVGDNVGYAELLVLEMFDILETNRIEVPEIEDLLSSENCILEPSGAFNILGALPHNRVPRMPEKTTYTQSPIFEKISKHITEPAVLSPKDERLATKMSPLLLGIEKYGISRPFFNEDLVRICTDSIQYNINNLHSSFPRRLLTMHENVNGNPDFPYINGLNMNSSPGYPWVLQHHEDKGKRFLFEGEVGTLIPCDEVMIKFKEMEEAALKGKRIPSFWVDTLKDERVKVEKIPIGKTRVFTIGPLIFNLMCRKYFLSFNSHVMENRKKSFAQVGINPFSMEWTDLAHRLLSVSNNGFCGDFSRFDGSLDPNCMYGVLDIVNHFYQDEFGLVRKVLFAELVNTIQIAGNCVYTTIQGNPSGNPLTVILNSFVNAIYMRLCWIDLVPARIKSLDNYDRFISEAIYGDDNIIMVSDVVAQYFNPAAVSNYLKRNEIVYTSVSKDGNDIEWLSLDQMTFLKCGFRRKGLFYLATLDKDVIYEMVNWVKVSTFATIEQQLIINIQVALRYAYFHGQEFFELFHMKLLKALKEERIDCCLPNYTELHHHYIADSASFLDDLEEIFPQSDDRPMENDDPVECDDTELHFRIKKFLRVLRFACPASTFIEMASFMFPQVLTHFRRLSHEEFQQFVMFGENTMNDDLESEMIVPQSDDVEQFTSSEAPVDEKKGIVFAETQERHIGAAADTNNSVPFTNDKPWTIDEMCQRYSYVETIAWGSEEKGTLKKWCLPRDVIKTAAFATPFEKFTFYRGCMRFRFQLNGTRFHLGKLIVAHFPIGNIQTAVGYVAGSLSTLTALNHVFIDASSYNAVELVIPYTSVYSYLLCENGFNGTFQNQGTLLLYVFNKLVFPKESASTLYLSMFVSLEDADFRVPSFVTHSKMNKHEYKQMKAAIIRDYLEEQKKFEDTSMGLSEAVEAQGNTYATSIVSKNWGKIASQSLPTEVGTTVFDVANNASLDKPNVTLQTPPIVRKPLGYFAHCDGFEYLHRMSFHPGSQNLSVSSTFGTTVDEMSFKYLLSKFTFYKTFSWTTSVTNLCSKPINPCLNANIDSSTVNPTLMTYISQMFTYWRGTIKVKIQIVASQFHSGRLAFCVTYGESKPTDEYQYLGQYAMVMDLSSGQREFFYEIPYNAITPWLRTGNTDAAYSFPFMNSGSFNLIVLNKLVYPAHFATSVDVNVFFACGDDFQLAFCGMSGSSLSIEYIWQADDVVHEEVPESEVPVASKEKGDRNLLPEDKSYLSDVVTSVLDVMKRYSYVHLLVFGFNKGEDDTAVIEKVRTGLNADSFPGSTYNVAEQYTYVSIIDVNSLFGIEKINTNRKTGFKTKLSMLSTLYGSWHGSLRVKLLYTIYKYDDPSVSLHDVARISAFYDAPQRSVWKYKKTYNCLEEKCVASSFSVNTTKTSIYNTDKAKSVNTVDIDSSIPLIAMDVTDRGALYSEIEIPYASAFSSTVSPLLAAKSNCIYDYAPGNNFTEADGGKIYIMCKTPVLKTMVKVEVFLAVGDDFRAGHFIGHSETMMSSFTLKDGKGKDHKYSCYPDGNGSHS